jgi:hypothetical protein
MIVWQRHIGTLFTLSFIVIAGCSAADQSAQKNPHFGLITTPPTYYTTQKGRYLGEKYKENLDRIVERIVRNPKTANLQFANNIASFGGIGFFTHSATSSVDERFLEVIMGAPETFDTKLDYSAKVDRLFSVYGAELLSILASDRTIDQEPQVNGYGLNLSWRNVVPAATGPRIALERTVLYLAKSSVRSFLKGDLTQNKLLEEGIIFAAAEDSPMKLVSYRQQELRPDSRPPIQEETLAIIKSDSKAEAKSSASVALLPAANPAITPAEEKRSAAAISPAIPKQAEIPPEPSLAIGENDSNMAPNLGVQNAGKPASVAEKPMPVVEKASAGPATLSLPSVERSKPEKVRTIEVQEAVSNRQEPAEGATTLASVEQEKTKPRLRAAQDDLQTVNIPLTAPLIGNPSDTETSLEQQGTELAVVEDKPAPEKRPLTQASQVLEGFVIQVPFADRGEAQHWAERFVRRGHTVSMTEASQGGSVRLRIGSFARREQAEQELQALRYNGLKGIILNFPQAYRPEVRPSAGRGAEEAVSVVQ